MFKKIDERVHEIDIIAVVTDVSKQDLAINYNADTFQDSSKKETQGRMYSA